MFTFLQHVTIPVRRMSLALFALAAFGASPVQAQFGEISNIDVTPPVPLSQQPFEITVSGRQGDSCHRLERDTQVEGNMISIDVDLTVDEEAVCPAVVVPFVFTEEIPGLDEGEYRVVVDINNGQETASRTVTVRDQVAAGMTLSPASGYYLTSQEFDFVVIVNDANRGIVDGAAVWLNSGQNVPEGVDISEQLAQCVTQGETATGFATFRCSGLSGERLGAGNHVINVSLELSDGSVISDSVVWNILDSQE